jgi:NAD+ kinase
VKVKRVLVVYKKSSYDLYSRKKDPHFMKAIRIGDRTVGRMLPTHLAHQKSLAKVKSTLKKLNIQATYAYRSGKFSDKKYDLVITVGGDGTFMDAAYRVRTKPILGVNSCPTDSVGIFCGTTAEQLEKTLKDVRSGRIKPTLMTRLLAKLNEKPVPFFVLNDLLVTHTNPAATSRYVLQFNGFDEEQKSSGLWLSTPAGTTAGIGSAGGRFLPISSKEIQFLAREIYHRPDRKVRMATGIVKSNRKITIYSKMRAGRVFFDGPHRVLPFPIGAKLEVSAAAPKLKVFAFNEKRRRSFR